MSIDIVPYPPLDFKHQSYEVPGTKRPGQTGHHRDPLWASNTLGGILPGETLSGLFDSGYRHGPSKNFLGVRPMVSTNPLVFANEYKWETYEQVDKHRKLIGSGLHALYSSGKFSTREFQTVGVWSVNRPEWQHVDLACHAYQKVGVSLYDTLGPDAVEYIINHAEIPIIFATAQHVTTLLRVAPRTPTVKIIVSIDKLDEQTKTVLGAWGKEKGVEIWDLPQFEDFGEKHYIEPLSSTGDTVASICYTSGTTNVPKGVVLTNKNLVSAALSNLHGATYPANASMFSYLPLAHIYERVCELFVMAVGGRIGYFTGDPLRLIEDVQVLKPYFFPSVPRVLNRLYMSAMQNTKLPGVKGALFRKALDVKLQQLQSTGVQTHRLWDALVFRKVQAVLGGKIGLITSGSAPISPDTMDFLKIAFACQVMEGYGLTETCATCCRVWDRDPTGTGTIGGPQPVNEIKLLDVPEMHYTSEDKPNPRGEILIRGANVFSRYYKDEKNTREALDDEGWFHTGDVAEMDSYGRLKIIDRIKNIMKLAQGEYVALEKVENVYTACPIIAQVYIHGDSLRDHLIAVVVPDPVILAEIAAKHGKKLDPTDTLAVTEIIQDKKINKSVLDMMTETAKRAGLKGFETAKGVHLTTEPFSVENGTLTPTFKIRRKDAHAKYKDALNALYSLTA